MSRSQFHAVCKTKIIPPAFTFEPTNGRVTSAHGAPVAIAATYFCPSAVREHSLQSGHTDSLRPGRPRPVAHLPLTLLSTSGVLQFISPMAPVLNSQSHLGGQCFIEATVMSVREIEETWPWQIKTTCQHAKLLIRKIFFWGITGWS